MQTQSQLWGETITHAATNHRFPLFLLYIGMIVNKISTNLDDDGVLGSALAPVRVAQQDVLRFKVSVDDAFGLQDVHGLRDLPQEHADGALA